MKRFLALILTAIILISAIPVSAAGEERNVRIFFTHDIHSYFMNADAEIDGKVRSHGGAARLKTLLSENRTDASVYVDAGDFSMGTLLQAGFSTDAYELRFLGELGCALTTFGNHEFDYGDEGLAQMLEKAKASGDPLPGIVETNMITDCELTAEQKPLADAMRGYGVKKYEILDVGGVKMAVFGLFGIDCLSCAPTAKIEFENYIESAKKTVEEIKSSGEADLIMCLSHCGTTGDGKNGEDFDLIKEVPDIDIVISGHSHTKYEKPVIVGKTILVSCGEYLSYLGMLDVTVGESGVLCKDYKLIPCDENVKEDEELAKKTEEYKKHINETYLKDEGVGYDDVLCRLDFDFMTLGEMTATHGEYPFGNLIADSYIYEAKRNGIDDIDVALVGLGTVRGSFSKGEITTADAFEICSLGVGADGSAGHPVLAAYITGKELKLMCELDASLGPMVSYIKMSYNGLKYTFNEKRVLLDRVTEICLVRENGETEEIDDTKLYKVACNMYAANMLGMLNGLTKGILKITPKFADGTEVENFYDCSIKNTDGKEIKEWVAFKNYLMSMPKQNGVPYMKAEYVAAQGRKNKVSHSGIEAIKDPGPTTVAVIAAPFAVILIILIIVLLHKFRKKLKENREKNAAAAAAENGDAKQEDGTSEENKE